MKEQLAKAVERIKKLKAEGNRPDAEKALEELRQSGDMKLLQKLLIKDRDEHRDVLIRRNREIAAVAMTFLIDSRLGGCSISIILVIAGYRGLRRPFGCAQGRLADDG